MDDLFRRFLFVEGLIPTSSLMTRTHLEGSDATPAGGIPSYCLTLSETVERRRAFVGATVALFFVISPLALGLAHVSLAVLETPIRRRRRPPCSRTSSTGIRR